MFLRLRSSSGRGNSRADEAAAGSEPASVGSVSSCLRACCHSGTARSLAMPLCARQTAAPADTGHQTLLPCLLVRFLQTQNNVCKRLSPCNGACVLWNGTKNDLIDFSSQVAAGRAGGGGNRNSEFRRSPETWLQCIAGVGHAKPEPRENSPCLKCESWRALIYSGAASHVRPTACRRSHMHAGETTL